MVSRVWADEWTSAAPSVAIAVTRNTHAGHSAARCPWGNVLPPTKREAGRPRRATG